MPLGRRSTRLQEKQPPAEELTKRTRTPSSRTLDHFAADQAAIMRKPTKKRGRSKTTTEGDLTPKGARQKKKEKVQEEVDKMEGGSTPKPVTPPPQDAPISITSTPVHRPKSYANDPTTANDKREQSLTLRVTPVITETK
jgi:hypothetical protein